MVQLADISLRIKVGLVPAFLIAVLLAVSGYAVMVMQSNATAVVALRDTVIKTASAVGEFRTETESLNAQLFRLTSIAANVSDTKVIATAVQQAFGQMATVKQHFDEVSPLVVALIGESNQVKAVEADLRTYLDKLHDVADMVASDPATGLSLMSSAETSIARFRASLAGIVRDSNEKRDLMLRTLVTDMDTVRHIFTVTSAAVVFLGLLLAGWIGSRITRPLYELQTTISNIQSTGDLSQRVAVSGRDETGRIAGAFNGLLGEVNALVAAIGGVMARAAANDLSARVTIDARGDIGKLKDNVNTSLDALSHTLRATMKSIHHVANATSEVSTAIGQISDGAQNQANAVKQIAYGIQQTAQAVDHVSADARASSRNADEASGQVAAGRQHVNDMVDSVNAIAENSRAIAKITGVIGRIATQTNMLSLNAAIEAARAGDAGKGFAVVAEEVGKLADHSGRSADEIAALIEKASMDAHSGVDRAQALGSSIDQICQAVTEFQHLANGIATAMGQQTTAIEEIRSSVDDLSRIGIANATAAEEVTATMVELSRLADQTRSDIRQFKF